MSLTFLSGLGWLLGTAALAGSVFFLQRLRVQRDERLVPTTIFWAAAQKETQARFLTERFRSPLTFLLLFAIAALLWLALAGPARSSETTSEYVVFVDGSAAMQRSDRFQIALKRAEDLAQQLPQAKRSIRLAGPVPQTLLAAGEPIQLLAKRTANLTAPAGSHLALVSQLASLATAHFAHRKDTNLDEQTSALNVIAIGAAPSLVELNALAESQPGLNLQTVALGMGQEHNNGILAFGAAPAASGQASMADLLIETTGPEPRLSPPSDLQRLPGQNIFMARDVPLDGRLITARLPDTNPLNPDPLPGDNTASLQLPDRQTIGITIQAPGSNPSRQAWQVALQRVLMADTGLVKADSAAQVAVHFDSAPKSAPHITITEAPQASLALIATRPPGAPPFAPLFASLALADLGTGLPTPEPDSASRPTSRLQLIERIAPGPAHIEIPSRLIAAPYELTGEREFPLLISLATRWLASTESNASAGTTDLRQLTSPDLIGRAASLENPASADTINSTALKLPRPKSDLWPLFAILASCLLAAEWQLVTSRRIP